MKKLALLIIGVLFFVTIPNVSASSKTDAIYVKSNLSTVYPFYRQSEVYIKSSRSDVNANKVKVRNIRIKNLNTGRLVSQYYWKYGKTLVLRKFYGFKANQDYEMRIYMSYNGERFTRKIKFNSYIEKRKYITYTKYIQMPLSCEATSLRVALTKFGVSATESEIMTHVTYDTPLVKECSDGSPVKRRSTDSSYYKKYYCETGNLVWGNPDVGFVGNINGSMLGTGWGVNPGPVTTAAKIYRPDSYNATGVPYTQLITEIQKGNPVLFWFADATKTKNRGYSWVDKNGIPVFGVWNHVRTAVGYGYDKRNGKLLNIYFYDPSRISPGVKRVSIDSFKSQYKSFGYKAVVVK